MTAQRTDARLDRSDRGTVRSSVLSLMLLLATAAPSTATAGFGGGFGGGFGASDDEAPTAEDSDVLDIGIDCVDRSEPSLWFDGRCRDEDWIVSTLATRSDRDFVIAYGSGLDDSGDAGILLLERASDTSGTLFLTTIVPYSLAPTDSPNRSGYAITSEEHFETGFDDYGGLTVRSTQYSVNRETLSTGLFGTVDVWDWSVDADSTMTVAEPYALSGSDAPDGAPGCADAAMMAMTQTRDWCEVHHVDASDKWIKSGFVVLGVMGAGFGIVGGGLATVGSGGLAAAPAIAIVTAGVGLMAGAEATYQGIVENVCGEVANEAFNQVIANCDEEPEEEPDIEDEPPRDDDPPEVDEGDLDCGEMSIPQSIEIEDEYCSCLPDFSEWVPDPESAESEEDEYGGEWVVIDGGMECSTSLTTTWECCDPTARDCSPGELEGNSNRDDLSCD